MHEGETSEIQTDVLALCPIIISTLSHDYECSTGASRFSVWLESIALPLPIADYFATLPRFFFIERLNYLDTANFYIRNDIYRSFS